MMVDPSGRRGNSFWRKVCDCFSYVGDWFSNTFGAYIDLSHNLVDSDESFDFFFGGFEVGERINKILGNDSKPISFFVTNASEWWKFWEYQAGININLGKFNYSYSFVLVNQIYH